jgi:predicted ATPase with chaperone activity
LTETGRNLSREALETNQYAGPVPVPLEQYADMVRKQRLAENWLSPEALNAAFTHLVVADDIIEQLGPAVNSNKSFLIYGQPGNGKTALAEAFLHIDTDPIYMPYAIECQGNIVQLYDPIYHKKIEATASAVSALTMEQPSMAAGSSASVPSSSLEANLRWTCWTSAITECPKFTMRLSS